MYKRQPQGKDYTFWGKGVSQGHSDAVRRIEGVADARQYKMCIRDRGRGGKEQKRQDYLYRGEHRRRASVIPQR